MLSQNQITLDCPSCHQPIAQPIDWFKQRYFTCPHCDANLSADRFDRLVADLEAALDDSIDAMLKSEQKGCGCGKGGCGKH